MTTVLSLPPAWRLVSGPMLWLGEAVKTLAPCRTAGPVVGSHLMSAGALPCCRLGGGSVGKTNRQIVSSARRLAPGGGGGPQVGRAGHGAVPLCAAGAAAGGRGRRAGGVSPGAFLSCFPFSNCLPIPLTAPPVVEDKRIGWANTPVRHCPKLFHATYQPSWTAGLCRSCVCQPMWFHLGRAGAAAGAGARRRRQWKQRKQRRRCRAARQRRVWPRGRG